MSGPHQGNIIFYFVEEKKYNITALYLIYTVPYVDTVTILHDFIGL